MQTFKPICHPNSNGENALPKGVVWRAEQEDGKNKKVPYNPNHHLVRESVKIPKSWETLDQALQALASGNYSGVGFMIPPPLVMIDLDNSYDRKTQTITNPQAEEIMKAVPTYFEASPNKGLHGLVYVGRPIRNVHTENIEIYGHDRFTTITTDHIEGTPATIELRTGEVEALVRRFAPQIAERDYQNTRGVVGGAGAVTELPPEWANDPLLHHLLQSEISPYPHPPSPPHFLPLFKLLHSTR